MQSDQNCQRAEESLTAVDDVRRVREAIAAQHKGNFREHIAETNRIFEELREKLNLKLIPPRKR